MTAQLRPYPAPADRCDHRWKGHLCVRSAMYGGHVHRCTCGDQTITRHTFELDPHDDAGNCWCGRTENDLLHVPAVPA